MLIMTQDRDEIINFDNFSSIYWNVKDYKFYIYAVKYGNKDREVCLGVYNVPEEMENIMDLILSGYNFEANFTLKMPKKGKVNEEIERLKGLGVVL